MKLPTLLIILALASPVAHADGPPEIDINFGEESVSTASSGISVSGVTASPTSFNPLSQETSISYSISQSAKVDVGIFDSNGNQILKVVDNQTQSAGNYSVKWNGTTTNVSGGNAVMPGSYTYKVSVKDSTSGIVQDTEQGQLTLAYALADLDAQPLQAPTQASQSQSSQANSNTDALATLTLQNQKSGRTSETGPEFMLYAMLPAIYIFRKTLFKKLKPSYNVTTFKTK